MQNWKELSSGLLMKIFLWHNNMEDGKSTHGKDPPGLVCLLDHTGPKWLHVSFTYEHSVSCEVVVRPRPSRVISPCVCPGELLNAGLRQGHRDQWPWSPSRRNVGQEATLTGRERRTPKFPHPPTPPRLPFRPQVWVPRLYLQVTGRVRGQQLPASEYSLWCVASPLRTAEDIINWLLRDAEAAHCFLLRDEWGPNLSNTDAWHWTQI